MSDSALDAFLALLRRELLADDAYLQLGGKATDGEGRFFHALDESTSVVVVFAEPPPDVAALHARLSTLSATFGTTVDAAVAAVARPRQVADITQQRLDEELSALCERAGAAHAFVFDLESPIIWGASSNEGASDPLERAARLLRKRGDELRQAPGQTVRVTLDANEALVRLFGGLYVLVLLFREPLSEPTALGAVLHAVGRIERLVLALPPIDPEPGAKILRLHRLRGV